MDVQDLDAAANAEDGLVEAEHPVYQAAFKGIARFARQTAPGARNFTVKFRGDVMTAREEKGGASPDESADEKEPFSPRFTDTRRYFSPMNGFKRFASSGLSFLLK